MPATYRRVRLYVPGSAYIGRVCEINSNFESIYNRLLWDPSVDEPNDFGMRYEPGDYMVVRELGARLRSYDLFRTPPRDLSRALTVSSIVQSGSFEINLSGLADTIDAAAEVCDPLRRRERREKLRHDSAVNRSDEEARAMENRFKSLEITQRQIDMINGLAASGMVTPEEAKSAIRALLNGQNTAARALERDGVEIVDVSDDGTREIEDS